MKSYFTFLSRHKLYTSIQAVGLIVSIAFIILIANYVWQQYTLAYSTKDYERVFTVSAAEAIGLSAYDKAELEQKLPGLETVTRYYNEDVWTRIGEEYILPSGIKVDQGFFDIFPEFELISGSKDQLVSGDLCVISEDFANKYFGDKNPLGEKLANRSIAGIYRLVGPTMVNEADVIWILPAIPNTNERPFSNIGQIVTIIKVDENIDKESLLKNITSIEREHYGLDFVTEFKIYSLPDIYFTNFYQFKGGDKTQLKILLAVVILLLISSMFNYVNLSLALSSQRSKEVAIRMLLGESRTSTILRSIFESLFFVSVCGGVAVGIAYIFRPMIDHLLMNILIQTNSDSWKFEPLKIIWNDATVFIFVGFILLLGVLAGVMPSIYAARNKPIDIVRGNLKVKTKMIFGKIFIVFQNIVTVMLISLSIVMEVQMNHLYHRPLHARMNNVFLIYFSFDDYSAASPLIDRINKLSGIKKVGLGQSYAGLIGSYSGFRPEESEETYYYGRLMGDKNYFDIMGLELIEGSKRSITPGSLFMSESLANSLQITEKNISPYLKWTNTSEFGGIYHDVPRKGAGESDDSSNTIFLLFNTDTMKNITTILVDVEKESKELEEEITKAYYDYVIERFGIKADPFEMGYVSELHKKSLSPIKSTIILLEIFMGLSLLISLLGLIAMSTYFANENTRSIAIRKVMGSDVKMEIVRNVKMYMIMVLVAIAFAIPLSVIIAKEYLSRFSYRIDNYWWIFVVSSLATLIVAFLAVIWQTTRAARTNPAIELKKE